MPKRAPKERPYHCTLCEQHLAEDELGFVCCHVAHDPLVTLVADPKTREKPMPDAACTACDYAIAAKKKGAVDLANIHVVCAFCYRTVRKRHIDDFSPDDRVQGFVLVKRAHYDRIVKRSRPLAIGPIREGRELKLGFSPIPSTAPITLERMWVRVKGSPKGSFIEGELANTPQLFARKRLKLGQTIRFKASHVLDIEAKPVLREPPPQAKASEKKATPSKKTKTSRATSASARRAKAKAASPKGRRR